MKFTQIQHYVPPRYRQEVPVNNLLDHIKLHENRHGLVLGKLNDEPWTLQQQIAYVEAVLQGCPVNKSVYLNHPGWERDFKGDYILVDGHQRLSACIRFVKNEIPAFGILYKDFDDGIPDHISMIFCVHSLKTKDEIKRWYKQLNPVAHA
jgi:hypothetical protein